MPFFSSASRSFNTAKLLLLAAATSVVFTAGCGIGTLSTAPSSMEPTQDLSGLSGKAMGGYVPIVGATATIYKTQNNGVASTGIGGGYYAGTATVLATATTTTGGYFTFTGVSCSDPDQLYITLSGGNSGGGQSNPNILLMAALGPCSGLSSDTFTDVNEVTTVAAAYALAGFMNISTSTSGGVTTVAVNITADANNYATAGAGSSGGKGTIYHPVGLQHAFLNAANLANFAQGTANTALPNGPTAAVMPAALINSIANVLQDCTNSTGSTPEVDFTGQTNPTVSVGATLTSAALTSTSDTLNGTLSIKYAGTTYSLPSATSSFNGATQATVLSAVQGITGLSGSTFTGGVLTIIGSPGTANTLSLTNTDAQYTGTGVASTLLDVPATPNTCGGIMAAALALNSSNVPKGVLQAALNIARNPYMGGAGKAATFLGLSSPSGSNPFTPVLTASGGGTTAAIPHDLTAAIFYPAAAVEAITGAASTLTYITASTLDANDTYYTMDETSTISTSFYTYEMVAMNSNGSPSYAHQYCLYGVYSQTAVAGTSCPDAIPSVNKIQADQLGNIWMVEYDGGSGAAAAPTATWSESQSGIYQFNASNGALTGPANTSTQMSVYSAGAPDYGIAIDQNNDIFVGTDIAAGSFIYELANTNASPTTATTYASSATQVASLNTGTESYSMTIDDQQNVYSSAYITTNAAGNASFDVLPNQTLAAAPTYPVTATGGVTPASAYPGTPVTPSASGDYTYSVATDASGDVFFTSGASTTAGSAGDGIYVTTPTYTKATSGTYNGDYSITAFATPTGPIQGAAISTSLSTQNVALARPFLMQTDGDGALWFTDVTAETFVRVYGTSQASASVLAFYPCVGATCYAKYASGQGLYGGKEVFIDSTGTVWEESPSTIQFAQIFGIGTPTYPLLQSGHPGQMP